MAGIGKSAFALHIAASLLCEQSAVSFDACGKCHPCRLVETDVHPNICRVVPEKEGHAIKVDQIRALAEFVQQSSLHTGFRIALINPAHSMNMNAANALLKTLEEPAEGAILILTTDQPGHLPATIRSRCQRIAFSLPDQKAALDWLKTELPDEMTPEKWLRLAHGAPLAALALLHDEVLPLREEVFQSLSELAAKRKDPLQLAAKWQKLDPVKWLDLFSGFIADLVRLQLGARVDQLFNQDYEILLKNACAHIAFEKNMKLMETILLLKKKMGDGVNYNKQLLMENLLIRWAGQS
jgi:DNA polymerase-3 subunit delta'